MANDQEERSTWLWWLSFADDEKFLGCVIAPGDNLLDAVRNTWSKNVNPGGQVLGFPIPGDAAVFIDDAICMRLLSKAECEAIDAKILDAVGRMSKGGAA